MPLSLIMKQIIDMPNLIGNDLAVYSLLVMKANKQTDIGSYF